MLFVAMVVGLSWLPRPALRPGRQQPLTARVPRLHCCTPSPTLDLSGDGGCLLQQLQAPAPDAEQPQDRAYVLVHFRTMLADGTRIHDSHNDGGPLELRIGLTPSELVRLQSKKFFVHALCVQPCTP